MPVTPEKELQVDAPGKETQPEKQLVILNGPSRRMTVVVASVSILLLAGAAVAYALPIKIALPDFSSLAELLPREAASTQRPDPVSAALKNIESVQQQNSAALQENAAALQQHTAMLQESAATLDSLRQGLTAHQAELKRISNQLSSLVARVDALQNEMKPLTTSSIQPPKLRARVMSRKRASRLPQPVGPVSVGGAPLSPAPAAASGAG